MHSHGQLKLLERISSTRARVARASQSLGEMADLDAAGVPEPNSRDQLAWNRRLSVTSTT